MWMANFIQIKARQVGGSHLGQCKRIFWFGLILHKFLMIRSKCLRVEGQQQKSDSNSNGSLLSQTFYNYYPCNRKLKISTSIKIKLTFLCVRDLL